MNLGKVFGSNLNSPNTIFQSNCVSNVKHKLLYKTERLKDI